MLGSLTKIAFDWGVRCFGREQMSNHGTRSLRVVEEAIELCQAAGVSREDAYRVVSQVYERPAGEFKQEIGGVLMTAFLMCEMMSYDVEEVFTSELRRVLNKPPEHFAMRNKEKINLPQHARRRL